MVAGVGRQAYVTNQPNVFFCQINACVVLNVGGIQEVVEEGRTMGSSGMVGREMELVCFHKVWNPERVVGRISGEQMA